MDEIFKPFQSVFDKLGEFFNIFDLSFIVSGFCTTNLLWIWLVLKGMMTFYTPQNFIESLGFVIIWYIMGIISFAAGRKIRKLMLRILNKLNSKTNTDQENILTNLKAHPKLIQDPLTKSYIDNPSQFGIERLYVRLWNELRKSDANNNLIVIPNRYWVMNATCDGLFFSMIFAIFLWIDLRIDDNNFILKFSIFNSVHILPIVFIILSLVLYSEANRYKYYQVEELVTAYATKINSNII